MTGDEVTLAMVTQQHAPRTSITSTEAAATGTRGGAEAAEACTDTDRATAHGATLGAVPAAIVIHG